MYISTLISTLILLTSSFLVEEHNVYYCQKTSKSITIDGNIYGTEWDKAEWSERFVDIQGKNKKSSPKFNTRIKMLYDDTYLYIAAELEEPHIWGTLLNRDDTIYFDNDFEVFIDPDYDEKNYIEFEINALGTEWDLLMPKTYNAGGRNITSYDIEGLKSAVKIYGTLNDPSDIDEKWTIEMAFPIKAILEQSSRGSELKANDRWKINFSRVEWLKYEIKDGKYKKLKGHEKMGSEENWVWSPMGVINMHIPKLWGEIVFCEIKP